MTSEQRGRVRGEYSGDLTHSLFVRIDEATNEALDNLAAGRVPPITKARLVRELIEHGIARASGGKSSV